MADWEDDAACRPERLGMTAREAADLFFPPGEEGQAGASAELHAALAHAKAICRTCPVRRPCLDAALERGETYGVWGGLSGRALDRARKHRLQQKGAA